VRGRALAPPGERPGCQRGRQRAAEREVQGSLPGKGRRPPPLLSPPPGEATQGPSQLRRPKHKRDAGRRKQRPCATSQWAAQEPAGAPSGIAVGREGGGAAVPCPTAVQLRPRAPQGRRPRLPPNDQQQQRPGQKRKPQRCAKFRIQGFPSSLCRFSSHCITEPAFWQQAPSLTPAMWHGCAGPGGWGGGCARGCPEEALQAPEYHRLITIPGGRLRGATLMEGLREQEFVRRISLSETQMSTLAAEGLPAGPREVSAGPPVSGPARPCQRREKPLCCQPLRTHHLSCCLPSLSLLPPLPWCRFTQRNLVRVYPMGLRVLSSNYCPTISWLHGAQMAALNMQVRRTAGPLAPSWAEDAQRLAPRHLLPSSGPACSSPLRHLLPSSGPGMFLALCLGSCAAWRWK